MNNKKIYDCFTFFNEIEMVKFRIEYLKDFIDYFVIVEAAQTHSGNLKNKNFPIDYFNEEVKRKIIYFYIDFPKDNLLEYLDFNSGYMKQTVEGLASWARENYQRNYLINGLTNANENDIILISDVDEIIKIKAIEYLKNNDILNNYNIISLQQTPFYYNILNPYFLNEIDRTEEWYHPKAVLRKNITKPNLIRMSQFNAVLKNAGWHFGYFGEEERVKLKHLSTAIHNNELNNIIERSEKTIKDRDKILKNKNNLSMAEAKNKFDLPDLIFTNDFKKFFIGGNNE